MYTIYNVNYGDTLEKISEYYNTDVDTLKKLNSYPNDYQISMGDQIIVPNIRSSRFMTYVIKKGDNLYEIARRYNVDVNTLIMINGLESEDFIYPNQEILVPRDNVRVYVTKQGDTINDILEKQKISFEELYVRNNEI